MAAGNDFRPAGSGQTRTLRLQAAQLPPAQRLGAQSTGCLSGCREVRRAQPSPMQPTQFVQIRTAVAASQTAAAGAPAAALVGKGVAGTASASAASENLWRSEAGVGKGERGWRTIASSSPSKFENVEPDAATVSAAAARSC